MKSEKGFLVVEMLIAGAILTASIAASMYLFRIGAENLDRVNNSNLISSKLPQAMSLLRGLDLESTEGSQDLGEGVVVKWKSRLIERIRPGQNRGPGGPGSHEIGLYRVDFTLAYGDRLQREYGIHVFKSKSVQSPSQALF